jgi:peptide/nickel transport system permease protein
VRRLLLSVLVIIGAATVAFAALRLIPGDPVLTVLGTSAASPAVIDQVRQELGLDRPLIVQYGLFVGRLLTGDLGRSYQLHQQVAQVIGEQLWPTVQLALTSCVLALVVSVLLATATAGRRPVLRTVSSAVELVLVSSPSFWVGVLLLTFFSFRLNAFPAAGGKGLAGLVLPAVTLSLGLIGVFTQVLRDGIERSLEEPFVLSSRARGTSDLVVRFRHALRHAFIPMVTLSGWTIGALLSGAVVVETVFSRPGIGRVLATAVTNRDLPLVSGIVVISTMLFIVVNVIVDVLYRVVDPRLRETAL